MLSFTEAPIGHHTYSRYGPMAFLAQAVSATWVWNGDRASRCPRSLSGKGIVAAIVVSLLGIWIDTDNEGIEVPDPKITLV